VTAATEPATAIRRNLPGDWRSGGVLSDILAAVQSFAGVDLTWIGRVVSLLVLPFAHEDLAIIFGAYFIVNELMPAGLVAVSIYGGMVASDFALYGIGAGARRIPWLNKYAVDDRVRRFATALKRNLFGLFALCRVVPGVVFVAFIACGWSRVPLGRFTVASLLVSAVYLPLMLYLAIVFGDAMDDHVGVWAWPLLLVALTATGFVRRRVFAFRDGVEAADPAPAHAVALRNSHRGMPWLASRDRKVAAAERIPPGLFYFPLILTWLGLGLRHRSLTLPTAANPAILTGGMWGESKSAYLLDVAAVERRWIADFALVKRSIGLGSAQSDLDRSLRLMADIGIDFPLVAKPDIGWHGFGVRRIDDRADLREYIARFPEGAKMMLQRFLPCAGEAAVLYARMPSEEKGRIRSLTFRYYPHVIGDGRSTLRDLIYTDPRARWKARLHLGVDPSHRALSMGDLAQVPASGEVVQIALIGNQRAGGLYRDARHYITPMLEARFDAIARSMSEFHYGRFDIRFESTEALVRGEDFAICEINGIGGEAIDAWDPQLPVGEAYRRLFNEQKLLFRIGALNRARGFRPTPAAEFIGHLIRQTQLIPRYPASS
jgi:membrane protein DedA with SNARE-associated domain